MSEKKERDRDGKTEVGQLKGSSLDRDLGGREDG